MKNLFKPIPVKMPKLVEDNSKMAGPLKMPTEKIKTTMPHENLYPQETQQEKSMRRFRNLMHFLKTNA